MSKSGPMDILLGIGFGELLPNDLGILVSLEVRTQVKGRMLQGVRDPMIIQAHVLEQLETHLPEVMRRLEEAGLDHDRVPMPANRIAWNHGANLADAQRTSLFFCTGIGFNDPLPEHAGPIAYIEGVPAGEMNSKPLGADYLMPYRVLEELRESIPKVLEAIQRGTPVRTAHEARLDFDFSELNFKWDPARRKVTMNRGYLSQFLQSAGVTTLPPMQELMDLLAKLYVLHTKNGGQPIAAMESCLRAHGITIKVHDPATISDARRAMDNEMDILLLEARVQARDAADAATFWQWMEAHVAPIRALAAAGGESPEFEKRYGEVLQLAKDAGLARIQ